MRNYFTLVIFLCVSILESQVILKLENDTIKAYPYRGGDEFNQPVLNEKAWLNGLGWRRVLVRQDLAFAPDKVRPDTGVIRFVANREDSVYTLHEGEMDSLFLKRTNRLVEGSKFLTRYSVGCIVSREKFHFGLYELRFKVEEGRGVWPAFWFYGGNGNDEIDVFELKGEKNNQVHVDAHCPEGCDNYTEFVLFKKNYGGWLKLSDYLHEGFNTMQLEWRENDLVWYVNGYPLAYYKGRFEKPMNIYINTSVAGNNSGFKPGPDASTSWPNTYTVDYLRIFDLRERNAAPVAENELTVIHPNDQFRWSDAYPSTQKVKPLRKRGYMYRRKILNGLSGMITLNVNSKGMLTVQANGSLAEGRRIWIESGASRFDLADPAMTTTVRLPEHNKEFTLFIEKDGQVLRRPFIIVK